MKRLLERRDSLTIYSAEPGDDLDLAALGAFANEAWKSDYRGQVRFVYDRAYFEWYLGGNDWVGVVVYDSEHRIVGCTFSVFRQILCSGQLHPATYGSGLLVSERYRGVGLGKWIVGWQRLRIFDECARLLSYSMFQAGHGGLKAVDSSARQQGNSGMVNFHQSDIWSRRLTGSDASPSQPLRWGRIWFARDLQSFQSDSALALPSVATFTERLVASANFAFAPNESFARMYLSADNARSGTWLYEFGEGQCAVSYSRVETAVDDYDIGTIAHLQLLFAHKITEVQLVSVLNHACQMLGKAGCIGASILEQGQAPSAVLRDGGFAPSKDKVVFSLRGRPIVLDHFPEIKLPVSVDFL